MTEKVIAGLFGAAAIGLIAYAAWKNEKKALENVEDFVIGADGVVEKLSSPQDKEGDEDDGVVEKLSPPHEIVDDDNCIVADDAVYDHIARVLRGNGTKQERKIALSLLAGYSINKAQTLKCLRWGIPDLLLKQDDELYNCAFILANLSSIPDTHRFFFSGRFDPKRFISDEDPKVRSEGWRILQNLSFIEPYMSKSKLKITELLNQNEENDDTVKEIQEKVRKNVE